MIVGGVQVLPTGTNHFSKSGDKGFIYAEIYEPALVAADAKQGPALGVQLKLLDGKTGELKQDFGLSRLSNTGVVGNPAVPLALVLNIKDFAVGSYQVSVTAIDEANHQSTRIVPIEIDN